MTVVNTSAFSGPFFANGVTTEFPFEFDAGTSTDVAVFLDGLELSPGAYVVEISDGGEGTVTISPAPVAGEIVIALDPSFQQQADFQRHGPYFPDALNPHLAIAARRDIYLREGLRRSVKSPVGRDGVQLLAGDNGVLVVVDGNIGIGQIDGVQSLDEGEWEADGDIIDNEGLWA